MKAVKSIIAGSVLLACSSVAQAEVIATRLMEISHDEVLHFQLMDADCADLEGAHAAFLGYQSRMTGPTLLPYATGCWVSNGLTVTIAGRTQNNEPFELTYSEKDFYRAAGFKGWDKY